MIDKTPRLKSMIGLSKKAGRLTAGSDAVISEIKAKKRRVSLVLAANDASDRTIKQISDKCRTYSVEFLIVPLSADLLGECLGKKSPIACAAILDRGFADEIKNLAVNA